MDFEGLQAIEEELEGSFTIAALTDRDELYFVKGNNPMCIYHYPVANLYVYVSTEEILKKAMLQAQLRLGKAEKVNLFSGEILRIDTRVKSPAATSMTTGSIPLFPSPGLDGKAMKHLSARMQMIRITWTIRNRWRCSMACTPRTSMP